MSLDTSPLLQSAQTQELIRTRTGRLGLIATGVGFAFYVARVGSSFYSENAPGLGSPSMMAHLAGALSTLLLWWICRTPRSGAVVRWSEFFVLLFATTCYAGLVTGMPEIFRADSQMVYGLAILLIGRTVYVPSSRRRTAILGIAMGVPTLLAVYSVHRTIDPGFRAAFDALPGAPPSDLNLQWNIVGAQLLHWVVAVFVASWVSGVLYGLRREVKKAQRLGQYQLAAKLGEGGMGVVYLAHHALLRRPTAIKLIRPDRIGEESVARLSREVRATAKLTHPNTVTIFDYGRTPEGIFYYAMELLEGANLAEVVAINGPLPASRVAHVIHQVAGALSEAHEANLVHRDIKPDNILLNRIGGQDDFAKVVDFGLVKEINHDSTEETVDTHVVGTPLYLPPETIRGEFSKEGLGDLYSLGAVAYFLLTGEHVFTGKTLLEVCGKHLERTPEPPSQRLGDAVPEDLEALVLQCLEKNPADRPASARILQERIEACESFGAWTQRDARRWWRDFGADLKHERESIDALAQTELKIDLKERSG